MIKVWTYIPSAGGRAPDRIPEVLDLIDKIQDQRKRDQKTEKERVDELEKALLNLAQHFDEFASLITDLLSSLVDIETLARVEKKWSKTEK